MALVIIRESSYEYRRLREDVFDILSRLDRGVISRGANVLIKPNLLAPARPEQALTTHPLLIRAASEYVLSQGAEVRVSDSSAVGSFEKVISVCGVKEALEGLPVRLEPLGNSREVRAAGVFNTLELSAEAIEADVILNLPKLKTHSQMGLTLAVKNLFGCIVGIRKPEWHYRVGENKGLFAELLLTVYRTLNPRLNLIDGILGMEGQGPGTGGRPRHIGVLMGSTDALSLDMAVCEMLGMEPDTLLTNRVAKEMGLNGEPELSGHLPLIRDFKVPDTKELLFGPGFARKFLRRHMASRPIISEKACKHCSECLNICPAGAIGDPGGGLRFDYERCIRCYCCLEVCPHGAMRRHETLLKRLIRRFYTKNRE